MKKENLILVISLAVIVPIWGTFHQIIKVAASWPAFASAALFFASDQGIRGSWKVALGHIMGFLWGIVFLNLINMERLKMFDSNVVLYLSLFLLTILAVLVTRVKQVNHLPSLFSGWAITVGALSSIAIREWGLTPLDTLLSMMGGVFFIGVGVSLIQKYLSSVITEHRKGA